MSLRSIHERTRILGAILALGLAFTAQYLFTGEIFGRFHESDSWTWLPKYSLATALLLGVIVCSAWAFSPRKKAIDPDAPAEIKPVRWGRWPWPNYCAGASYLLSIGLYLALGENIVVDGLWLAGIGFLIVPLWLHNRRTRIKQPLTPLWEIALVALITLAGFVLRYWRLTEIPAHVDNDVALMGTFALQMIQSNQFGWVGFSSSAHLVSYVQLLAWSMRLFGQNQYGVVMISVLSGTASLPLVYLLGRELGGRLVGFVTLLLLTLSYTHIQFSRILFGALPTLAAILAFYFIFRGLHTRQPVWFALAGLSTGWGMLTYDSGRIIPIMVVSLILWQAIWQRQEFRLHWKNWLILGAGLLIGFGPMLGFAWQNFSDFWGRGNSVFLWTPVVWEHETLTYQTTNVLQVLIGQTWRTFLTLHLTGDGSPHFAYTRPMVTPISAAFFVVGIGCFITRLKDLKWFVGVIWFLCPFIFGGVLTYDPPSWTHLNIALPGIFLLAAFGVKELIDLLGKMLGKYGPALVQGLIVIAIVTSGAFGLEAYYHFAENNPGLRIGISRYLNTLPPGYHVYLISTDFSWSEYAFRFFNRGMAGQDLKPDYLLAQPPQIITPALFVFYDRPDLVPVLQRLYPGGKIVEHSQADHPALFTTYALPAPTIPGNQEMQPFIPIDLPGWWLIGLALLAWLARLFILYRKQRQVHPREILHEPEGI